MKIVLTPQIKAEIRGVISRGIKAVEIDESGHLIFTLTDDTTVDLGRVVGADGAPGMPGADGADGFSPTVTVTEITGGHSVTVTDKDHPAGQTFEVMDGADGVDGTDGRDGTDGTDGTDGITPTIGENGNWYLGDADTGKPSRGAQGQPGAKGDKGDKGDTGETGPQGPKGDTGETGATGPAGATTADGVAYNSGTTYPAGSIGAAISQLSSDKVDKVNGKGLSTNDYDNTEKAAVAANTSARHSHNNKALLDQIVPSGQVNYFYPDNAIAGQYFNGNGTITYNSNYWSEYIPHSEGITEYTFVRDKSKFGSGVSSIPYYDASKNYLGAVTGVIQNPDDNLSIVTITVSSAMVSGGLAFFGYSGHNSQKSTSMFVSGSTYPSSYIQPGTGGGGASFPVLKLQSSNGAAYMINKLYGKKVVFDGDSICYGNGDTATNKGWAGRIGVANEMNWHNLGDNGACITNVSGDSHRHLSVEIDNICTAYPTLDYLILEGGTNDADRYDSSEIQLGTFSMTDYSGSYDISTFCGAMDYLIYKAVSFYPTAKIGFIIAHKMGNTQNYDTSTRRKFFDIAEQICRKWGVPVIDLWNGCSLNPKIPSIKAACYKDDANDYQHLSSGGYDVISPLIEEWMVDMYSVADYQNALQVKAMIDEAVGVVENGSY